MSESLLSDVPALVELGSKPQDNSKLAIAPGHHHVYQHANGFTHHDDEADTSPVSSIASICEAVSSEGCISCVVEAAEAAFRESFRVEFARLEFVRSNTDTPQLLQEFDSSGGVSALALISKSLVFIPDCSQDSRYVFESSPACPSPLLCVLCVPVFDGDKVTAVITAGSFITHSDRASFRVQWAETLARVVGESLRHTLDFRHLSLENRKNAALLAISRIHDSEDPLPLVWRSVIRTIQAMLHPQLCSIFLLDYEKGEVFNVASIEGENIEGLTLPFGTGIVGTVAASGVSIRTGNAYDDPRFFRHVDTYTGQTTKSVVCLPVPGFQRNSRPIAVVQCINKEDGTCFEQDEEEALDAVAHELSNLLRRKAMEINELRSRVRRLRVHVHESEDVESSILKEYGVVTKQYEISDPVGGVKRRVSFLNSRLASDGDDSAEFTLLQAMEIITNYNTDPFLLQETSLIDLSVQMLCSYDLLRKFSIDILQLKSFLFLVRSKYRPVNRFHNFKHAWGVMHVSFMLLRYGADELLTSLDIFALLLSAICHDVDHPGNNNAFEIALRSPLAIRYADDSVLERHHLAVTHEMLEEQVGDGNGKGILSGLSTEQLAEFRASVTSAILATDMSQHFKILDDILRRTSTDLPYNTADASSRRALIGHILHAADLGAQTQCREVALKWTDRLVDEFSSQAQREIEHCLPLTPFLHGLDDELKKMNLQVGFLSGVVMPLWSALSAVLPPLEPVVAQLESNRRYYAEKAEQITASRSSSILSTTTA